MRLGFWLMPVHPPHRPRTDAFEQDAALVRLGDALGYDEAWIGEHVGLGWEPIPANDVFIAHLIPQTTRIRLGTGVTVVPHHHPVNIASRLALLDHLSRGRINCAFGQGGAPTDGLLFDLPDAATQGRMTGEGIDLVLRLWQTDGPWRHDGEFWHVRVGEGPAEVCVAPPLQPYQKPHPPVALTALRADSRGPVEAGRRGFGLLSANFTHAPALAQQWRSYAQAAQRAGRATPDRSCWRIARNVVVGQTAGDARRLTQSDTFQRTFAYYIALMKSAGCLDVFKHDPAVADADVTPAYVIDRLCIVGTPDACADALGELADAVGGFGTLLMVTHDWDQPDRWRRSIELLATEVAPRVTTWPSVAVG